MGRKRLHHAKSGRLREVKGGFNWLACFLGGLWSFANRGWLLGLFLLAANVVTLALELLLRMAADDTLADLGTAVLHVGFMYACGRHGNEWLARTLVWQGYRELPEPSSPGEIDVVRGPVH